MIQVQIIQAQVDAINIAFGGIFLDGKGIMDHVQDGDDQERDHAEKTVPQPGKDREFRNGLGRTSIGQVHGSARKAYGASQHDHGNTHDGVKAQGLCNHQADGRERNPGVEPGRDTDDGEHDHNPGNYHPFFSSDFLADGTGGSLKNLGIQDNPQTTSGTHEGKDDLTGFDHARIDEVKDGQWVDRVLGNIMESAGIDHGLPCNFDPGITAGRNQVG